MNNPENFRIIVVDDEVRAVEGLVELLRLDGYVVTGYSEPLQVLEHLKKASVDLLLTDLKMPEMDGLE